MDMYLFVESSIRGGLSQISKRFAKANNKNLSDYDETFIDSYILYLDVNNLYEYTICEFHPKSDWKWNTEKWTVGKI